MNIFILYIKDLDIFKDELDNDSVDSANWFSNIGLKEERIKNI